MRNWVWPLVAVAVFGIALPLVLVLGCEAGDRAIGAPGDCGYGWAAFDQFALTLFDWVAISSMLLGIPILIFWLFIFVVARFALSKT